MVEKNATDCYSSSQHERIIPSIHTLSDDLLLKLFYYCRPVIFGDDDDRVIEAKKWNCERWWYDLAQVCQKWRYLVFESASYLDICLFCSYGTLVAEMLTHSPPLPLVLDYSCEDRDVVARDEEGILLALQRRLQVRRIRLWMPVSSLRRLVTAMDGEFPMLESLHIKALTDDDNFNGPGLSLPDTFNAPHLRHFTLRDVIYSPGAPDPPSPASHVSSAEIINGFPQCHGPEVWRLPMMLIHILDDDSLLNIFNFCHPVMVDEDEANCRRILQGGEWDRERWWYKLVKVCRRWRRLILASTSYLGLNLLCTFGTPVADMLAHSPRLPLVLDYLDKDPDAKISTKDEERIMLALQLRDRVRRIRLRMPLTNVQRLIAAVDGEFPTLEYLYMVPQTKHFQHLILPDTFRAPHLRHLILNTFSLSILSPLIATPTRLVILSLHSIAYFGPNDLLQQLSILPQLETLRITFHSPILHDDVDMLLSRVQVITHVTLPNLRWFGFRGANAYLEVLLSQMTTPLLVRLETYFWFQVAYSVPHLLKFMGAAQGLKLGSAKFVFYGDRVTVDVFSHRGTPLYSFRLEVSCSELDKQVAAAAQIFVPLRTVLFAVEYLFLEIRARSTWWGTTIEADRRNWRALLEPFGNVKTLCVRNDFLTQFSRSLQLDGGEFPTEILPEMKQLEYHANRVAGDTFDSFINARKTAGHPVTLVRL